MQRLSRLFKNPAHPGPHDVAMNTNQTMSELSAVLDHLATVADGVTENQRRLRTPCSQFDVAALTGHIVGWLENFAGGFASPDGQCPEATVDGVEVPRDEAGPRIRSAAEAIANGATDRDLAISGQGMPGDMALSMILAEYIVHGWDLARATGQEWAPSDSAVTASHEFLKGMVTPDSRGQGGWFGEEIEVSDDAPALDRLLAFTGRDPHWSA